MDSAHAVSSCVWETKTMVIMTFLQIYSLFYVPFKDMQQHKYRLHSIVIMLGTLLYFLRLPFFCFILFFPNFTSEIRLFCILPLGMPAWTFAMAGAYG